MRTPKEISNEIRKSKSPEKLGQIIASVIQERDNKIISLEKEIEVLKRREN